MNTHSSYLSEALEPQRRAKIVKNLVYLIELSKIEFDAIAFIGVSGALIAPLVAAELNKPLIVVRKQEDGSHANTSVHSQYRVEGDTDGSHYILIDDFVATGYTFQYVIETMKAHKYFSHYDISAVFCYRRLDSQSHLYRNHVTYTPVPIFEEYGSEDDRFPKRAK